MFQCLYFSLYHGTNIYWLVTQNTLCMSEGKQVIFEIHFNFTTVFDPMHNTNKVTDSISDLPSCISTMIYNLKTVVFGISKNDRGEVE